MKSGQSLNDLRDMEQNATCLLAIDSTCSELVTKPWEAMNGETLRRKVTITDPQGFHMRPATVFAQRANQFQCAVTVSKEDRRVNGKSPIELLLLFAPQGTELTLEVSGPDAPVALDALAEMLAAPALPEPADQS